MHQRAPAIPPGGYFGSHFAIATLNEPLQSVSRCNDEETAVFKSCSCSCAPATKADQGPCDGLADGENKPV